MSRQARVMTDTNTYHVMMRGINKQKIFCDDNDCNKFLSIVLNCKTECGFTLYAYCLMGNHAHMVIRESDVKLENIFKKINTSYAMLFNYKYTRIGHLFQDRFKSEPVTNDAQLMQTVRYVHRNPIKAGLCDYPEEYRFSSYKEYIETGNNYICDTSFVLDLFGSVESFRSYTEQDMVFECLDLDERPKTVLNNDTARSEFLALFPDVDQSFFKAMPRTERRKSIMQLREKHLTISQISMLTGISRAAVSRAIKA